MEPLFHILVLKIGIFYFQYVRDISYYEKFIPLPAVINQMDSWYQ